MKRIFIVLMLLMLVSSLVAQADTLTPEQKAIIVLLKKLYTVSYAELEEDTFGAKYRNCEAVVKGKYDPDRQCVLLAEFLVNEAVIKEKGINQGCMSGFRYPGADTMDLGPANCSPPPPAPHFNTPVVNGDKAKVHVTFPKVGTNVMYYLVKKSEGWRIYRAESSINEATIETEGQGDMVYVFPPEDQSK